MTRTVPRITAIATGVRTAPGVKLRRRHQLLAGAVLAAAVTIGAAAPTLAYRPDPCSPPPAASTVGRAS